MKNIYFKHLFTALLMLCATAVAAHDFEVGGIYYNILSEDNKTVEVTYKGTYYSEYSNEYSGSVVIPQSVTYNGSTYSVTSIGDEAFCYCNGLTSIEIPNSLTSIREFAFDGCTGLNEVHINDLSVWCNIYFYDYSANPLMFAHNLYLNGELVTELKIPEGVKEINNYAFYRYINLTSIVIPNSVISIGDWAFCKCSALTSIEIPNSVISIGDCAFDGCEGLTCIEIPNSVTRIGMYAFDGCENLNEVHINDIAAWCNIYLCGTFANPLFFAKNLYINGKKVTELIIPNNVRSINYCAFQGCSGLTNLTIPNSVTSIGSSAFSHCTGLASIISLIPADALFEVDSYTFYNVDKNVCTLYVPVGSKSTYASTEGWNEFANIVELEPTEVTVTIGQYGSATYCSPYALDFSNVEGLKAYAATGYNRQTQVVTLTKVQTAEAGVGLFLKGEPGEYVVPVIEYSNDYTLNLLVGTLEQTTVNSTDGAMSNYKFTIAEGNDEPMFYPFEDGTAFSAGKAYLQIPTAWLPVTAQKSLNIRFDEGETTDIDELEGENGKVKTIYDLQGRVVEKPTSGIYIIDGKKVIIK